jgi:hypothetical protein
MTEGAYAFIIVAACLVLLSICSFAVQVWMRRASTAEPGALPHVVEAAEIFARANLGIENVDQAFKGLDLDYSVASLKLVDQGLESLWADLPDKEDGEKDLTHVESQALTHFVFSAGAYVGEVIRRNSGGRVHWVRYEMIEDEARGVFGGQKDLSNFLLLKDSKDGVLSLPMNRIGRFLANGAEDSTYAFAVHVLKAAR